MASDKTRLLALYDVDKQAKALLEQGRPGDALAAVDDCLAALAAAGIALPADKSIVSSVRRARAKALIALGRKDEARATLGEVVRDPLLRTAGSLELGILLEALALRSALAESDDLDAALVDLERIVRLLRSNRERIEPLCRMALLWARRGVAPLALRTIALVTGPADFSHTGH
ncbi:MAG: hypothetical protein HY908_18710, partial [Myxococcales bacterium]|nr:hypothetical protein [Myxococcales bacterium]